MFTTPHPWFSPFLVRAAVVGSLCFAALPGEAAEAPGGGPNESPVELQEIVVTATKTKEVISKVPISMVALSNQALEESGVKSVVDLAEVVPGVQFDQVAGLGAGTNTYLAIRGINSTIGTSTTGVYLDDTPLQTRVASLSYWGNPYPAVFDLERVEVERGPQGTLFGAGAEGGAVRFITPEPSLTGYSGTVHSEVSDTAKGGPSYEGGLAFGGPIVNDRLGVRLSVWDRHDGGYIDRVSPFSGQTVDANANWANTLAARLAVRYAPTDDLSITPSFFSQVSRLNDSSAFYTYLGNPADGVFQNGRLSRQPSADRLSLPSLKIEAGLPAGLTLTSISSFMSRIGHGIQDGTSVNGSVFGGYGYGVPPGDDPADYKQYWSFPTSQDQAATETVTTNVKTFSQEIRVANSGDGRARWTAGAFYSRAVQTDTQTVYGAWVVDNVINPVYGADLKDTDPLLFSQIRSTDQQTAGFGQLDYKLTPELNFTLGGRLSHATAAYTQTQSGFLSSTGNNTVAVQSGSQAQTPWSGKVGLSYFLTPNDMLYASASRGYRIGGANQPINSAPVSEGGCGIQAPATYGSDKVNSFEVGTKGKANEGHVRFDAAGFYVDWIDIQQSLYFPCAFGYITNGGIAHSKGLDMSVTYDPAPALTLNAAVTYTNANFTKTVYLPTSIPGTPGSLLVAAGDKLGGQGSAPWNVTASFDYRFRTFGYAMRLRVEDIFKSHDDGHFPWMNPLATLYSPDLAANPSTNILNGRLTLSLDKWEVALFVNNLLNTHPTLYRYQDIPASLLFTALTLRPRTAGISVDYRL